MVPQTANAHSPEELDQWERDWIEHVISNGGLNAKFLRQYINMQQRHVITPSPQVPKTSSRSQVDRSMGSSVEQWRPLVAKYFPAGEVDRALCVMKHESGGNPNAKNPNSSARGLMQVLASLWAPAYGVSYEDLYAPTTNMSIARKIWDQQGWGAWMAYNRGLC